jgi:hypothetical protein
VLKAAFAVTTDIVTFAILPPAVKVTGEKVAVAPAGRPLAEKLTVYRNVVATAGVNWMV